MDSQDEDNDLRCFLQQAELRADSVDHEASFQQSLVSVPPMNKISSSGPVNPEFEVNECRKRAANPGSD